MSLPPFVSDAMQRVRSIVLRRREERELDEELRFHLEMAAEELRRRGAPHAEARRQSAVLLGGMERTKEDVRDARGTRWLEDLTGDVAFALRALRRSPGFAVVVVAMLSLGIGANTAIFSLLESLVWRQLPVPSPQRLIALGDPSMAESFGHSNHVRADMFSYPEYVALRERNHVVSGLAASGELDRLDVLIEHAADGVTSAQELEHPSGRWVSGNYFRVLQVSAAAGRVLDGSEDAVAGGSAAHVIAISYAYWMRRFGGDPAVVGRNVLLSGVPVTIIGVAPSGFTGDVVGLAPDVWVPITMEPLLEPRSGRLDKHDAIWLLLFGRVTPGVSFDAARAAFRTLVPQVLADEVRLHPKDLEMPPHLPLFVGSAARGFSEARNSYQGSLTMLLGGVALLLLIVCANVASLLLARSVARAREMAVRVAVGAASGRLVRQLLTENAVLGIIGAGGGALLALWLSRVLVRVVGANGAVLPLDLRPDVPVLLFTTLVSLGAVGLFGLVPALRATRVDVEQVLRAAGRGSVGRRVANASGIPFGRALIAGQVALSLVLVLGATLFVRSLRHVEGLDAGVDRAHLLMLHVNARARGYEGDRLMTMVRELSEQLAAVPGVASVSYSQQGLFSYSSESREVSAPGFPPPISGRTEENLDHIGPGYVAAVGGRLVQGREFTPSDAANAEPVALVNQTMARGYFSGQSPVGHVLRLLDSTDHPFNARVVGVLADVTPQHLGRPTPPLFYVPYLQHYGHSAPGTLWFAIRAAGAPTTLIAPVRRAIAAFDPLLPIDSIAPLARLVSGSLANERLLAQLTTAFGVLALFLAAIGLYGILSYAVNRRTGEIGLRLALGADEQRVAAMVLLDALRTLALGVVVGIPLALGAGRVLRSQLHGVAAWDPLSVVTALAVMLTAACVAALLPALRAAHVAPLVALRED